MAAKKGSKRPDMEGNKYSTGRPTKFKEEYIQKLITFFDIEPFKQFVSEKSTEYFVNGTVKKQSEKVRPIANRLPTLFRFSREIEVDYTTVYRWAEKGDDEELELSLQKQFAEGKVESKAIEIAQQLKSFCKAYKAAKELQKEFLISLGLSNTTMPASFIFVAKNITDLRDKIETDITSGGEPIKISYVTPVDQARISSNDGDNTETNV